MPKAQPSSAVKAGTEPVRVEQWQWRSSDGWSRDGGDLQGARAQIVLVFGAREALETTRWYEDTRRRWPGAHVVAASTAGEIVGDEVRDGTIVATAIHFERTRVKVAGVNVREYLDAQTAGAQLAKAIDPEDLAHVFVLCDGHAVNGSELARGLTKHLPPGVAVTGGLAGDAARFEKTYVCANGPPMEGKVAVVALYGRALRVGYGSLGGWDAFGEPLRVTRSRGNLVEQLDGEPALDVYKRYLGEQASGLPASGLLHPLSVTVESGREVVRTLLSVDEDRGTLTFAGDVPLGARARMMRANFDRLMEGASGAAAMSRGTLGADAQLAILISCVGRKLVLQEQTVREVAAVRKILGGQAAIAGFYSYGEICPSAPQASCELHNQTMTITTLREDA